ncbi:sugar kinase [Ruegeria sp. HKCCD8929]|uniref:sugar kinase n=1 Tax=Ruegeria sp. HKCCD8929 TaxID=2683006 RepID=UPI001488D189|nr:sugar kinase [Ruegeria sp. HKCCD8929]
MNIEPKIRKIACLGEVMIELSSRQDGLANIGVAGDTYNTAVYLRRLLSGSDVTVSYVTALGTDRYSEKIRDAIRSYGLETECIERRDGGMPGLYAIDTDENGERSFSYWRSASAARTMFSEPCEIGLDRLRDYDLLFLSGISLAILPASVRERLIDWCDGYQAAGGLVAYDSNHRPKLWENQEVAQGTNAEMWRRADIALPSIDDEMVLFGDRDEETTVARLVGYGIKRGALKRGSAGPRDLSGQVVGELPLAKEIVDSTAAGDSFNAGYLAALVEGQDSISAIRAGHKLAMKVIAHRGAIIPGTGP